VIRDIGGAVGGAVGPLAPPKAPLHRVGGTLRCPVGGSLREHLGKEAGGIRRRGGVELQLGFRIPCIYLVQP